ncbi:hypothetical protein RB4790 [Rhodopirellula baltica SH 1]|uniref:Uncharacterized protein n=1 Tax=Rhodopirellula baltica (strain DSM 10527 / NCIMB 13988 / SH1) TaxID=243090 RepID=Q7UH83_RHOBA|nr:hypothetical protein RB4790 [Rhodopirellula baltica SH 1]
MNDQSLNERTNPAAIIRTQCPINRAVWHECFGIPAVLANPISLTQNRGNLQTVRMVLPECFANLLRNAAVEWHDAAVPTTPHSPS